MGGGGGEAERGGDWGVRPPHGRNDDIRMTKDPPPPTTTLNTKNIKSTKRARTGGNVILRVHAACFWPRGWARSMAPVFYMIVCLEAQAKSAPPMAMRAAPLAAKAMGSL